MFRPRQTSRESERYNPLWNRHCSRSPFPHTRYRKPMRVPRSGAESIGTRKHLISLNLENRPRVGPFRDPIAIRPPHRTLEHNMHITRCRGVFERKPDRPDASPSLLPPAPAGGTVDPGAACRLFFGLIGGDRRLLGVVQRLQLVLQLPSRGRAGQCDDADDGKAEVKAGADAADRLVMV